MNDVPKGKKDELALAEDSTDEAQDNQENLTAVRAQEFWGQH